MSKTENAVRWMEETAKNDAHGYDQAYRWNEKGDYDCSSAVITAWQNAGVPVKTAGATYTRNMLSKFKQCGFKDVTASVDLKTGSGLVRGDVLLNRNYHTAMYCGGGKLVQASINEKGTATGGAPGDQTGKEFYIRSYYNYPWTNVLRYNEKFLTVGKATSISDAARSVIRGEYGNEPERSQRLKLQGFNPDQVQAEVNRILSGKKSNEEIADEVIRGAWGCGAYRTQKLKLAGYDPGIIQQIVNDKLMK